MKNILVCGEIQVGKSTLIEKVTRELNLPVYGYITKSMFRKSNGDHEIYIFPAGCYEEPVLFARYENNVFSIDNDVLNTFGVRLLNDIKDDGIIVLDEIGFLESGADLFCSKVIEVLSSRSSVIAAVKSTHPENKYLNSIRNHPNCEKFCITKNNRDELYNEILSRFEI